MTLRIWVLLSCACVISGLCTFVLPGMLSAKRGSYANSKTGFSRESKTFVIPGLIKQAKAAQEKEDYSKAIGLYLSVGKIDSSNADAISGMVACWKQVVWLNPISNNYGGLGHALVWAEQYDEAEVELNKALQLNPKNEVAIKLLKYIPEARKNTRTRILVNEGVNSQLSRNYDKAIKKYEEALTTNPNNEMHASALANLGTAYHNKGNEVMAVRYYAETILRAPNDPTAAEGIGVLIKTKLKQR